jgi:hypothetical protein
MASAVLKFDPDGDLSCHLAEIQKFSTLSAEEDFALACRRRDLVDRSIPAQSLADEKCPVLRTPKRPVGSSWRVDETYVRTENVWKYLYRAVNEARPTVDFLLRPNGVARRRVDITKCRTVRAVCRKYRSELLLM